MSIETAVRSPDLRSKGWLKWTCDTGAAISAFPLDARIGTELLTSDRGGMRVQGTTEYGYGATFQGGKADVHKTLTSVSKVHSKDRVAVVDSNGCYIILFNSTLARKIQQLVQKEIVKELGAIHLFLVSDTYIEYTKTSSTGVHEAIKNCARCIRNNSRGAFGTLEVGKSDLKRG